MKNPPLKSFRLDFQFEKPEKMTLENIAQLSQLFEEHFPSIPNISLMEYPTSAINLPLNIGPFVFQTNDKKNHVELFANGLIFVYTNYDNWQPTRDIMIKILRDCCNQLEVKKIFGFRMEYIDEFNISRENFNIESYFNLFPGVPSDFVLDFTDFHLGIKIESSLETKFIMRLRGIQPLIENFFTFLLESLYIDPPVFENCEEDTIIDRLNKGHEVMIENFKKAMNLDYYAKLESSE